MALLNPVTIAVVDSAGNSQAATTTYPVPVTPGVEVTVTQPVFDPNSTATMTETQLLRALLSISMASQNGMFDRLDAVLAELKIQNLMLANAFDLADGPDGFRD